MMYKLSVYHNRALSELATSNFSVGACLHRGVNSQLFDVNQITRTMQATLMACTWNAGAAFQFASCVLHTKRGGSSEVMPWSFAMLRSTGHPGIFLTSALWDA